MLVLQSCSYFKQEAFTQNSVGELEPMLINAYIHKHMYNKVYKISKRNKAHWYQTKSNDFSVVFKPFCSSLKCSADDGLWPLECVTLVKMVCVCVFPSGDSVVHSSQRWSSSPWGWWEQGEEDRWHSCMGPGIPQSGPGHLVWTNSGKYS